MRILTAKQIAYKIEDNKTIAATGFICAGLADEICYEIEQRFLKTGHPKNLTLISATSAGDGSSRGLNRLAHAGLLSRIIAGHWNLMPKLQKLASENSVEAYNFPQGVICMLYRDIAAKRPGHITHIGLNTFVDPRISGGKINSVTNEDLVSLIEIEGREYLLYKSLNIDYALLRGTTSDMLGNITHEKEALLCEATALAQAAKNSGGKVFVQVQRIDDYYPDPQKVYIPGIYVDAVCKADRKFHPQTALNFYNPSYSGQKTDIDETPPMKLDARKLIARRAALELTEGAVVNLGIGIPEGIAAVAKEEGISEKFTLTVEAGPIGGVPSGGLEFGCSANPQAVLPQYTQFDFYHGGGLDLAFLGMAQTDKHGNINVSKFGPRIAGCGGFIGITQSAKKLFFCGTFCAGGLRTEIENGRLIIENEGSLKKFVREIEQITFSAANALKNKTEVTFITERAVFKLCSEGLMLTETAPGIDIQKDILDHMDFQPVVRSTKMMDVRIFKEDKMGL